MTVIQIGHENRLISFTFCSHFQRLFQIRKCFICPTLHWLNTRNRCLQKNVLIIIISGLQLRLIPTTDPSSGKQTSCSPLWKHQWSPTLCLERLTKVSSEMLPTYACTLPSCFRCLSTWDYQNNSQIPTGPNCICPPGPVSEKKKTPLVNLLFICPIQFALEKILPRSVGKVYYSGGQTRY